MTIKLIVTDMDETFLRADKTYDEEKAKKVFSKLDEQGVVVAIASGNYVPLLESYFDEEILSEIYLAGDDGNVLKNIDGEIRTLPLDKSDAKGVYDFIEGEEGRYLIFSTGEKAYVKGNLNEWAENQITTYYEGFKSIEAFEDIPDDKEIVKVEVLSEYPLEENKKVMEEIREKFPNVSSVTSGEEWLDIYHKDGGKGEAVKFLQEKYSITKDETMCFGDSLNDMSMMKEAHYSIAMENADDELKKHCHYEIGTSEDQAVLNILEQLIETESVAFLEQHRL